MKSARLIKFILPVVCVAMICGCAAKVDSYSGVDFVMDTFVEQRWYGKNSEQAYKDIRLELQQLESKLSFYFPKSEISELNSAAGKHPVALSDECYSILKEAVLYCEESGGIFDITVAPLTKVWDVTAEQPKVPADEEIASAKNLIGYKDIVFNDKDKSVMLKREGMSVDLGAVAKGAAAGRLRKIADEHQVQGYVSLGGNIMMHGKKPDRSDFIIGVRDPRGESSEFIATVTMDGLIMATTGDYERYFEQDGVRYHHILDPFTGKPSDSGLISVTVFSENGTLADSFSTSIFLQGKEGLNKYLNRDDCMIIAVTEDFDVYASPALRDKIKINPSKDQYNFIFGSLEEN